MIIFHSKSNIFNNASIIGSICSMMVNPTHNIYSQIVWFEDAPFLCNFIVKDAYLTSQIFLSPFCFLLFISISSCLSFTVFVSFVWVTCVELCFFQRNRATCFFLHNYFFYAGITIILTSYIIDVDVT